MSGHSKIGASGAHRWIECAGSVALSEGLPNRSSEEADEGTAHHEVAAECLKSGADAWEHIGAKVAVNAGLPTERAFVIEEDGANAVQVYLDAVRGDIADYETERASDAGAVRVFVEQGFHLVHVDPDAYGTADCVVYFPGWKLLKVYDYKHGKGVAVHVENNPQLQYYGLGALVEIARDVPLGGIESLELVVVQPRCASSDTLVHRWRTSKDDLIAFKDDVLIPAIARTRQPNAPLKAGDHCQFCPAKLNGVCPVLNKALDTMIENTGGAETEIVERAKALETWELADKLNQVKLVRFAIKTLEQEAERRLLAGETIPGKKLVHKKADRVWKDGGFEAAVEKFGEALCYERKGKSPAQLEKLKDAKAFVAEHAYKPDTGLTVADEDDRRVGVTVRPAADRFIGIKTS